MIYRKQKMGFVLIHIVYFSYSHKMWSCSGAAFMHRNLSHILAAVSAFHSGYRSVP